MTNTASAELDNANAASAPDHEVIHPPTDLRRHARPGQNIAPGGAADPIARAERALAGLEGNFASWLRDELDRVSNARDDVRQHGLAGEHRAILYRAAHDIRGQAATLGYPLAGHVADSLCQLLDAVANEWISMPLLDQHVDAMRAIVVENAKGDGSPVARQLVARLAAVTDELIRTVNKRSRKTKSLKPPASSR